MAPLDTSFSVEETSGTYQDRWWGKIGHPSWSAKSPSGDNKNTPFLAENSQIRRRAVHSITSSLNQRRGLQAFIRNCLTARRSLWQGSVKESTWHTPPQVSLRPTYLQHIKQPLPATLLHAILVHKDAAQVQEAGVLVLLVHAHHLPGEPHPFISQQPKRTHLGKGLPGQPSKIVTQGLLTD